MNCQLLHFGAVVMRALEARLPDRNPESPSSGTAVVQERDTAGLLLNPLRRKILESLTQPGSASTVAAAINVPRQLVNYHLRVLEKSGLVEEVATRARRGLTERIVRATAAHYLVSPDSVGRSAMTSDTFSSTYQVAVAARTIREVAALADLARKAGKPLSTLTLDTEVSFATPADRESFGNELVRSVNRLAAKYSNRAGKNRRTYRLFAGAHPVYQPTTQEGS